MKFSTSAAIAILAAPAVLAGKCKGPNRQTTTGAAAVSVSSATPITTDLAAALPVSSATSITTDDLAAAVPALSTTSITSAAASSETTLAATVPESSATPITSAAEFGSTTLAAASPVSSATSVTSAAQSASTSSSDVWNYLSTVAYSGTSTFYGGNLNGGACSFTTLPSLPAGIYGTAYSGAVWDNAAECGACIEVVGLNGATIKAMIVDECPECDQGHLDLFPDAFTALGGTTGLVDTTYKFVECGITSPLVLHNKAGTSQYWFSMQVVNANEPVASLEVSVDGGSSWTAATRTTYNFFEYAAGFKSASMDIRVTSITGKVVTYDGATPDAEAQFTTDGNF